MISEWMKVMLEEIARKKADAEQAQLEQQRRRDSKKRPRHGPAASTRRPHLSRGSEDNPAPAGAQSPRLC